MAIAKNRISYCKIVQNSLQVEAGYNAPFAYRTCMCECTLPSKRKASVPQMGFITFRDQFRLGGTERRDAGLPKQI